jgi:N-acetylneuraminate synthase
MIDASPYPQPTVVAEIGCNHKGDLEIAREMIRVAARFAKADYVKFQKRHNVELLTREEYEAPHPDPNHSYGATYGAHREHLELDAQQHARLVDWCRQEGIGYATSVWDLTSAQQMSALEPDYLKVPSACNLDQRLLDYLATGFHGDIHVSLGMTTEAEQEQIVARLECRGAAHRTVLYACTSGYPVPFSEVCLLEITRLRERFGHRVKAIGFSGHHLGIAVDAAATALGAAWVERHFTLDRTWKGTDHAASLEPDGLRRLVRDLRAVHRALRPKTTDLLGVEKPQRRKLKRLPGVHLPL